MSLQEDGLTLKIDHSDNSQSKFTGGRGSTFTGFSTSNPPMLMKYRPEPQMLPEIPVKLQAQVESSDSSLELPSSVPSNNTVNAAQAIYDSGDQAKIQAWERFIAAKTKDNDASAIGSAEASDLISDISVSVNVPSALDDHAVRITDKSMIVDSHIHFRDSPLGGSTKPTHSSDSLS